MVRALRLHWFTRGRLREGYEQIIAVTEMPESAAYPALRADALTAAGFITRELGDYQRAYDVIRASLAISHQIHDRKRAADALVNLGFIALQRGQIDDARSLLQRSLTASRELHNDQGIADSLGVLALTDVQLGDLHTAGQRLEQCIAIWSRLDDLQGVAWANTQLGLVRIEQGDYPAAWESLITSLTMANRLDFRGDIYLALDGLARLALVCDRVELACRLEATSAAVREESGIRPAPIEQDRIDRLRADLDALPDRATISDAWTLDQLTQMVSETLAPLLAIPIPATSPAMPAVSHAEPTN